MAQLLTKALNIGYNKYIVQSNLNLSAQKRDLICLTGTNGSGKSTLLRTLAGLQPAISGEILISDKNISSLTNKQKAHLLSLVLTDNIEVENLSIRNLVAMGRIPYTNWHGKLLPKDNEKVEEALNNVNLMHKAECKLSEVSDGEKQRAVIAKALAQDTPLVLLDEPTAHLDLPNRIEVMLLLRKLSVTTEKTFILSTHELDLALQISDKIWLMTKDGIREGIPEDLMLYNYFQNAFGSKSFYFDENDGHCHLNQLVGPLQVSVINKLPTNNKYESWMRRALIRTGIQISENSKISINCFENGYTINDLAPKYDNIETTLEALNHL